MKAKTYNKFIKYFNINEVSKFSNFNNFNLLSSVKSISVWFSLDLSREKSKLLYHSKILLGTFLIYLITNKYPNTQSSKDQRIIYVQSNLVSSDLVCFLEKFLIIYNSRQKKTMVNNLKIEKKLVRFLVTDLNLFTELYGCIQFFGLLKWVCVDIYFNHEEDYRNFIFLNNLVRSSYLI
jgi:hypothetical protein